MAIANDAFDDTFLNLIRGIDSQDRLTFLTGLELFHYSKVMMHLCLITTDLYHSYLCSLRYLRKSCMIDCMIIL